MAILTPEQKATLAAELAKPEYAGLAPPQAADLLNAAPATPGQGTRKRVPIGTLLAKIHELGLMHPLQVKRSSMMVQAAAARAGGDATAAGTLDAYVALIDTALGYFLNPHIGDVDMDKTAFRGMLAGLKQLAVLDDANTAILLALADAPGVTTYGATPFQALFGSTPFVIEAGDGQLTVTNTVSGTCLPAMVEEALS